MDAQEFMTPLQRRSRHVNSNAYEIPRSKTDYHMNSFFPKTIREWNSLANETVNAPNLTAFKTRGGGGTWVNVCWVCAAGLSEPQPHFSLFFGQL